MMTDFTIVFWGLLVLMLYSCFKLLVLFGKIKRDLKKFEESILIHRMQMEKQQKRVLKSIDVNTQKAILDKVLEAEIYLITDLTLAMLAYKIQIPTSQLSQLFSKEYHSNFNTIINSYRIEYAVKLLNDNNHNHSIDKISQISGFNSRSSFYRAFKNTLNTTPSKYKQLQ